MDPKLEREVDRIVDSVFGRLQNIIDEREVSERDIDNSISADIEHAKHGI